MTPNYGCITSVLNANLVFRYVIPTLTLGSLYGILLKSREIQ